MINKSSVITAAPSRRRNEIRGAYRFSIAPGRDGRIMKIIRTLDTAVLPGAVKMHCSRIRASTMIHAMQQRASIADPVAM